MSKAGNLAVPSLPRDAWDRWCRKGVVCFAFGGLEALRIFFANPNDRSVYHVVDFNYAILGGKRESYVGSLSCTLVGSRIYVLGGGLYLRSAPVAVHYCDAAANQQPTGGYEWKRGPDLNTPKRKALVFSLAGTIYVLSLSFGDNCDLFEVLKDAAKDGSKWESQSVPPSLAQELAVDVIGSCVDEYGKQIHILVRGRPYEGEEVLCTYNAVSHQWEEKRVCSPDYRFPVDLGNPFVINGGGSAVGLERAMLDRLGLNRVESLIKPEEISLSCGEIIEPYPKAWHLVPLRGGKSFCLLALYTDLVLGTEHHVRFATFDLGNPIVERKPCGPKKFSYLYEITNFGMVDFDFAVKPPRKERKPKLFLMPYYVCSKFGWDD